MEAQQRDALYATKLSALVGAPAGRCAAAGVVIDGTAWFLGRISASGGGARFSWADQLVLSGYR